MGQWKYTLKNGKALRAAIGEGDDYGKVLDALAACLKEINAKFPDDYEDYELEEDLEDIENQRDNLENYADYDMTYEDVEDEINYLLDRFYDLCDGLRIWVGGI